MRKKIFHTTLRREMYIVSCKDLHDGGSHSKSNSYTKSTHEPKETRVKMQYNDLCSLKPLVCVIASCHETTIVVSISVNPKTTKTTKTAFSKDPNSVTTVIKQKKKKELAPGSMQIRNHVSQPCALSAISKQNLLYSLPFQTPTLR